ncbi:glycosyltransferase family 4 protein [Chloroflexota bacterium]
MIKAGFITYGLDRIQTGIGRYSLELLRKYPDIAEGFNIIPLTAGRVVARRSVLEPYQPISLRASRLVPALLTVGAFEIQRVSKQLGLDLIHDPIGISPFFFGVGQAKKLITIHDVIPLSCPGNSTFLDSLIYHFWLPRITPRVSRVITVSESSKRDIIRYLGVSQECIRVIHQGIGSEFRMIEESVQRAVADKYQLPQEFVLFVGSIEKRKNLVGVIEAMHLLAQLGARLPLVVVGPKLRNYPELERTIRQLGFCMGSDMIFTGYINDGELPIIYNCATLFVFPSFYEGFGFPPLEAMACGTPVICSDRSSLPEIVGQAALQVDPENTEALAKGIERIWQDRELARDMREKGLAQAEKFTWQRTAQQTLSVYREAIDD